MWNCASELLQRILMMSRKPPINATELKTRISDRVLAVPGVSGIGSRGGKLTIYLAEDSRPLRRRVHELVLAEEPEAKVSFVVTGLFEAAHQA